MVAAAQISDALSAGRHLIEHKIEDEEHVHEHNCVELNVVGIRRFASPVLLLNNARPRLRDALFNDRNLFLDKGHVDKLRIEECSALMRIKAAIDA